MGTYRQPAIIRQTKYAAGKQAIDSFNEAFRSEFASARKSYETQALKAQKVLQKQQLERNTRYQKINDAFTKAEVDPSESNIAGIVQQIKDRYWTLSAINTKEANDEMQRLLMLPSQIAAGKEAGVAIGGMYGKAMNETDPGTVGYMSTYGNDPWKLDIGSDLYNNNGKNTTLKFDENWQLYWESPSSIKDDPSHKIYNKTLIDNMLYPNNKESFYMTIGDRNVLADEMYSVASDQVDYEKGTKEIVQEASFKDGKKLKDEQIYYTFTEQNKNLESQFWQQNYSASLGDLNGARKVWSSQLETGIKIANAGIDKLYSGENFEDLTLTEQKAVELYYGEDHKIGGVGGDPIDEMKVKDNVEGVAAFGPYLAANTAGATGEALEIMEWQREAWKLGQVGYQMDPANGFIKKDRLSQTKQITTGPSPSGSKKSPADWQNEWKESTEFITTLYDDNDAWNVSLANVGGVVKQLNLSVGRKYKDKGVQYITYEELKNMGADDATVNQFNQNDIIRIQNGKWNKDAQDYEVQVSLIGDKKQLRQTWLYDMGLTGSQWAKINKNTTNW